MLKHLTTASDVIDELGGTKRTADFLGATMTRVSNWRARNRLPAETYFAIAPVLEEKKCVAPLNLWRLQPRVSQARP